MVAEGCTGLAQRDDLGVGRGIVVGDVAVPSAADDAALAYNYCSDRNFADLQRALRGAKGFLQP